jgi:hypothetical protein
MHLHHFHPYWQIAQIVRASQIHKLHFSFYNYRPQSLIDERKFISVSKEEFLSREFISELLARCPLGHDLALHSNTTIGLGDTLHIPMIDMATGAKSQIRRLASYLGNEFFDSFTWYDSGRSYHGYSSLLITQTEWVKMMGLLLLANQKNLTPLADPRWIGHRLIAGYAALRWTKNTEHYISGPQRINLNPT